MTGLDHTSDQVLEIAVLVTDDQLNPLDEGLELVVHQPTEIMNLMESVVSDMHHRSGLTSAVRSSDLSLEEAERRTLAYIKKHAEGGKEPLCGNSIGIDRRFLDAWLPKIEKYLHYHVIDVTSIKELAKRWYPAEAERQPKKKKGHRALDDVLESIEELRYWRTAVFKPQGPQSDGTTST